MGRPKTIDLPDEIAAHWMTLEQVSSKLKKHRSTIRRMVTDEILEADYYNTYTIISRASIAAYLNRYAPADTNSSPAGCGVSASRA